MRVSTALLHRFGVEQMQRQQQALLRTQTQLTTQQRLLSAADGPADWAAGMGVEQLLAETSRYQANAKTAQHRLGLEENALAEGIDVLARVRELAIQANSGTQTDQTRAIARATLDAHGLARRASARSIGGCGSPTTIQRSVEPEQRVRGIGASH